MEIKILKKTENKLVFVLKGIDPVFANTLRRTLISEVPVLAIRDVTFAKNSSALFDEIIANRLGLLPLKGDLKSFNMPNKCSCKGEGCSKCKAVVTLNSEGPVTVYASDLKFKDQTISPIYSKIPIVKLLKGQEIEFEATITLGIGKEHAKYSPCLAYYQGYPIIKIEKVRNAEDVANECPTKAIKAEGKNLEIDSIISCTLCGACADIADPEGGIEVKGSETDFIFTIESWGQMSPSDLLLGALDVLDEKLDEFEKLLDKAK